MKVHLTGGSERHPNSMANLSPVGHTNNPGGRPKKTPLTDALRMLCDPDSELKVRDLEERNTDSSYSVAGGENAMKPIHRPIIFWATPLLVIEGLTYVFKLPALAGLLFCTYVAIIVWGIAVMHHIDDINKKLDVIAKLFLTGEIKRKEN